MAYTPTPEENLTYTDFADGDYPAAVLWRVWLEALSDGEAWALAGGSFAAPNWHAGGGNTNGVQRAAWHETDSAWFACGTGGNDFGESSHDYGKTWVDLSGALGSGKVLVDVGILGDHIVFICSDRTVYKGTRTAYATYTWAPTGAALSVAVSGGTVDYEPTAARLITCYRNGATGHYVDTSTNGTAWTARTIPAAWTAYTGTNNPEIACVAGRAVAVFADNVNGTTHDIQAMYSTDGGTNWTNVTITSALSAADFAAGVTMTRPVYDAVRNEWYFAISKNDGTLAELYKSTDGGATWNVAKTFTALDVAMRSLALIGRSLVAVTTKGRIVRSKDSGANWTWAAGLGGSAGQQRLRAGGGGGLVLNSSDKTSRYSLRFASDIGKAVA